MQSSGIAKTAPVVGFNPENIISDALFYDENAMSAAEIQSFLDRMIGACATSRCLNVLSVDVPTRAKDYYSRTTGNLVCRAMTGGNMRVSELIYRVQKSCGISAKVTLVTLQKEQSLISGSSAKAPSDSQLRKAMGHLCPDTAPCDASAAGVANQIVGGVEQLKKYKATAFGKQPGRNWIGYNPDAGCGGTFLNIQNYGTAALYNFTPYQPNAAALGAGSGLGDACSSYGNRNFYNFYTSWFGSTQAAVDPCKPPASESTTPAGGEVTTTANLNGRPAPTTDCATVVKTFPNGTVLTRLATYGNWTNVRHDGVTYWVSSDFLKATPAPVFTTDRVQGIDRYETAAAIAAQTNPQASPTVYLVSGESFADSVIGASLAARGKSALLLTGSQSLPASTSARLSALKPGRVVILGGPDAVGPSVETTVRGVLGDGVAIERIAGIDRYETARSVTAVGWKTAPTVYFAAGADFPDALSATSVAAAQGAPVLLVDGRAAQVPQATVDLLRTLGVKNVVVAGGPQAVSATIDAQLVALGVSVQRNSGDTRYSTSLALAQQAYPGTTPRVFLASGSEFPDALAGSVLAASAGGPLILQPPYCMTGGAKDYAVSHGATKLTLLGGPAALSDTVARAIRC